MRTNRSRVIAKAETRSSRFWWWSMGLFGLLATLLAVTSARANDQEMVVSHGYSFFGDLTYPADYTHFDYVNPDAPKGGEIALGTVGTFDSMNPYTRKGRAGALSSMMYESLLGDAPTGSAAPADVYGEYYGLLAERLEYPKDKEWVIFYMRPEARFSDGSPVTAHDVAFSHNLLLDEGLKSYADAVRKRIPKVEVIDDHTIKFYFAEGISRRSLIDQVGFIPAWSKKWYEETGAGLDESRLEVSPGSGPYMLDNFDVNRRIVYKRNPDYWGNDLPFNVGRNNFDAIRVEYFGDDTASFEAFKAGEYTFKVESDSKKWATGYEFPKVNDGSIVTEELPDGAPPTPSGIVFNLGTEALQDKRVREALALAYNFEWTNESLQYGLFEQRASYTQDTPLMATGV
ncbi:MAG: ABC transporter substrate-binding protein, partial [Rhodobacteraceae bacterium]|nr:ABC transporter substrate-binding protein [Paracoccaceae bacterium]